MSTLNPPELETQSSRRAIRTLLAIFVALFLVLNTLTIFYFKRWDHRDWKFLVHLKWDLLKRTEKKIDWLILGDSSGNQGVRTDTFEKELNESAINLCTIGPMITLNDSWMLDYYIQHHGAAPPNVLMVHVYDVWHRDLDLETISENPMLHIFADHLQPELNLDWSTKFSLMANNFIPLYYRHHAIKALFAGEAKWFSTPIDLEANGYNPRKVASVSNVKKDILEHVAFTRDSTFSLGQYNRAALDHIANLTKKYSFDVYISTSPIYDTLYALPSFQRYYAQVDSFLMDFSNRNPRIHIINRPLMQFRADQMQNVDHIIDACSDSFTRHLIEDVKKIRNEKISAVIPGAQP